MEIFTTRLNIASIRNVLNAAEALQDAGEHDKARDCLHTLARTIDAQAPRAPVPAPPERPLRKSA